MTINDFTCLMPSVSKIIYKKYERLRAPLSKFTKFNSPSLIWLVTYFESPVKVLFELLYQNLPTIK